MKPTQLKDAIRNIWKQKMSFLSIIVIAFLGVTTFLGLDYSAEALLRAGADALQDVNFRDIEVISTLLLTEEDLEEIRSVDGVIDAEAVWQTAAKIKTGITREDLTVISATERINNVELQDGRLPEISSECAVEEIAAQELGLSVGDSIELSDAYGNTPEYLINSVYEITGIIHHPDHTSPNYADSKYVLVQPSAFDTDELDGCFMKAVLRISRGDDADLFDEEYNAAVEAVIDRLESLSEVRAAARDIQIRALYDSQLADSRSELDSGAQQLEDSRKTLDDGWTQLTDAELLLADGEAELADAKVRLSEGEEELTDAKRQLSDSENLLAESGQRLSETGTQLAAFIPNSG